MERKKRTTKKPPPSRLATDTLQYFLRIEDVVLQHSSSSSSSSSSSMTMEPAETTNAGTDDNDIEVLVQNALKETHGHEREIAMDPECSRVLQLLLRHAPDALVRLFYRRLMTTMMTADDNDGEGERNGVVTAGEGMSSSSPSELLFHRNGSHVLQTIVQLVPDIVRRESTAGGTSEVDTTYNGERVPPMRELFLQMCESFREYWVDAAFDSYGSHILRVVLNVLGGLEQETLLMSKSTLKYQGEAVSRVHIDFEKLRETRKEVPDEFGGMLLQISEMLIDSITTDNAAEFLTNTLACPVLQILMIVLDARDKDQVTKLVSKLLNVASLASSNSGEKSKASQFVVEMMQNDIGSHFFEVLAMLCPLSILKSLQKHVFHGNMVALAEHPCANYVVARFVAFAPQEKMLANFLHELFEKSTQLIPKLSTSARAGLLEAFVASALRLESANCQKRIFPVVQAAFRLDEEQHKQRSLELILYLQPLNILETGSSLKPNLHGSKIVQGLMKFSDPDVISMLSQSLLGCKEDTIVRWCKEPVASRIVESFMGSKASLESKHLFCKRLKGHFVEMALDKFGGRVVETCWKNIDLKNKEAITTELAGSVKDLKDSFFGRFVLRTCRVEDFLQKRENWRSSQQSSNRKAELFRDILEDGSAGSKSKKRKHDSSQVESDSEAKKLNLKKRKKKRQGEAQAIE